MIYLDASYLVRLYYDDRGFEAVRHLATTDTIACAQHGEAEVVAAFHRKYREGNLTKNSYRALLRQFADDMSADAFRWLVLSPAILDRMRLSFDALPPTLFLRASDAIHLATASENGFPKIYSNDKNLFAA